jgi:UDP-N-acetylmuramyl tripeptide synthase
VLVAGKGHEAEQVVGNERRAFSDRAVVAELLGVAP